MARGPPCERPWPARGHSHGPVPDLRKLNSLGWLLPLDHCARDQASRRTSSQPPATSATAVYKHSRARPAHGDGKCGQLAAAPPHGTGLVALSELPTIRIGMSATTPWLIAPRNIGTTYTPPASTAMAAGVCR